VIVNGRVEILGYELICVGETWRWTTMRESDIRTAGRLVSPSWVGT
jgi:hypothetical protein